MKTNELIKFKFKSFMNEYGFSLSREIYSPEIMGNTELVFTSRMTGIKLVVDRGQVLVNIGPSSWPEDRWFELSDVVHFYAPHLKDVYIFQRDPKSKNDDIESQVNWIDKILRKYCEPLLQGNFSDQDQIKNVERKRVQVMLEHFKGFSTGKDNKSK